ncbi:MAG: hypothetical protein H0V89_09885, partial [Deltaproteobacteria bacterium]|nr:hypothetical protein [Deltaproteobacteria bacterium]
MSTAINMTFGTLVLSGMGALSLDLGYANLARVQVQTAADSAAISAAISIVQGED